MEFDAVFLYGLESLKDPSEIGIDPEERDIRERFERLNLVGPTRAKDRLYIYYKRPNRYVRQLVEERGSVRSWTYPDDYPGES